MVKTQKFSKFGLIFLSILVVLLAVLLLYTYMDHTNRIRVLNVDYDSLYTEYQSYKWSHVKAESDFDSLRSQLNDLESIVKLEERQTILDRVEITQPPNALTPPINFRCDYAGYLEISLESNTTNTYVIVEFWFKEKLHSFNETIGTFGTSIFCVLPSTVSVYVGNTNSSNNAVTTITIIYHY